MKNLSDSYELFPPGHPERPTGVRQSVYVPRTPTHQKPLRGGNTNAMLLLETSKRLVAPRLKSSQQAIAPSLRVLASTGPLVVTPPRLAGRTQFHLQVGGERCGLWQFCEAAVTPTSVATCNSRQAKEYCIRQSPFWMNERALAVCYLRRCRTHTGDARAWSGDHRASGDATIRDYRATPNKAHVPARWAAILSCPRSHDRTCQSAAIRRSIPA